MSFGRMGGYAASAAICVSLGGVAVAQQAPAVKAFHPAGPMPSYEVATVKPADPSQPFGGTTLRKYIGAAYGVPLAFGLPGVELQGSQVIGGPEWIDKERYQITGKPPDEMRDAMQKMPSEQRRQQNEMLEQSLLAERFHLKVHFETREMQVFELVPAKGGLKITPVNPTRPGDSATPRKPGELGPGNMSLGVGQNGLNVLRGRSMSMEMLINAIRGQAPEIAGRPILNDTGFNGNFDLEAFRFVGLAYTGGAASAASAADPDAPSLSQALEQQLGLKLVRTKAPVEMVVIDSIDRPTGN